MNIQNLISISKTELISALFIFIAISAIVAGSRLMRITSNSAIIFEDKIEVILTEKADVAELQTLLKTEKVIFDEEELVWASRILGWRNFQKGRYIFEGNHSYNGFLSKMARGIQDPVSVVILPGTTVESLSYSLSEQLNFSADEFKQILNDSSYLADKKLTTEQLFGRMLPETYLIYWTTTPKDLLDRILREFDASITQEYLERAEELEVNLNEVLTLASIVEWEAKNEEEKARISGLYWNRLKRGMRLQADPTVNFALGERRRLLFEDYQIDHPFNTYMRRGLPPGPITNPHLSTIEAALYPEDHDYLYMVANPEGGHIFTKTFREHRAESEKWRIWLREQYRIKRQQEEENQKSEKETR